MRQRHKRRKKLINPAMQLGLSASFGGIAVLAMLLQFLVLGYFLFDAFSEIEGVGAELADEIPTALLTAFGVSLLVLTPLFVGLGILLTFRYAGPLYRFEQYLGSVARGEELGPCRIRKGDKLQRLCEAINLATEPLRKSAGTEEANDVSEDGRKAA